MQFTHFSKNGKILPIEQATIPLSHIEYSYGFGVYETLRVRNGILYFADQHIKRLLASASVIGLQHSFSGENISEYLTDLTRKIGVGPKSSYNLKILLIGGKDPLLFILPLTPYFPTRSDYKEGVKTISVRYERQFPKAKTLNMLPSFLAYKKAKEEGCYDTLAVGKEGNILEGTRTNFFLIRENTIFMPHREQILDGVTMMTVLYVAEKHDYTIEEKDLYISEISEYDGAFLTSTSSKIMPIKTVDSYSYPGISESTVRLMKRYDEFLKDSNGVFTPDKEDS